MKEKGEASERNRSHDHTLLKQQFLRTHMSFIYFLHFLKYVIKFKKRNNFEVVHKYWKTGTFFKITISFDKNRQVFWKMWTIFWIVEKKLKTGTYFEFVNKSWKNMNILLNSEQKFTIMNKFWQNANIFWTSEHF